MASSQRSADLFAKLQIEQQNQGGHGRKDSKEMAQLVCVELAQALSLPKGPAQSVSALAEQATGTP